MRAAPYHDEVFGCVAELGELLGGGGGGGDGEGEGRELMPQWAC